MVVVVRILDHTRAEWGCPPPLWQLWHARQHMVKLGDEVLSDGEGKYQLGAHDDELGQKALEEGAEALLADHVADDAHSALGCVERPVLDAGLDHIQRRGHCDGGSCACDGGDKRLAKGGILVVLELEHALHGQCRATEEREGARRVAGHRPTSATIQVPPLLHEQIHHPASTERVWVGLGLDLEHIKGQQDHLANADHGPGKAVHQGLGQLRTKGGVEVVAEAVLHQVTHEGLTTELVDALEHLVARGEAQAGEERRVLAKQAGRGGVAEDDRVHVGHGLPKVGTLDVALVAHQPLGDSVDWMETEQLEDATRG
mmetsp:Transcript_23249/g.74859  ORF Transcript_23249/g.74859 Transcript_23249/m.74859 type:complete len:315 (+) Transcript_23249:487-1431(+)